MSAPPPTAQIAVRALHHYETIQNKKEPPSNTTQLAKTTLNTGFSMRLQNRGNGAAQGRFLGVRKNHAKYGLFAFWDILGLNRGPPALSANYCSCVYILSPTAAPNSLVFRLTSEKAGTAAEVSGGFARPPDFGATSRIMSEKLNWAPGVIHVSCHTDQVADLSGRNLLHRRVQAMYDCRSVSGVTHSWRTEHG